MTKKDRIIRQLEWERDELLTDLLVSQLNPEEYRRINGIPR